MIHKAMIKMKSTLDGVQMETVYDGEYTLKEGVHNFVYTDFTGNAVTKNAVEAGKEKMLLHRVGAISGDMLFDRLTDTITRYAAFMVTHSFLVHTYEYKVETQENMVDISLIYGLNDGGTQGEIRGEQKITIEIGEEI